MSKTITYRKGYKYKLAQDYVHPLPDFFINGEVWHPLFTIKGAILRVRKGYAWDGASGPAVDTPSFMRGSLVHDVFYQMLRENLLPPVLRLISGDGPVDIDIRKWADKELRSVCREDGMGAIRAWWVYRAVRNFASRSARVGRPLITAP